MFEDREEEKAAWQEQFPVLLRPKEVMDILGIGKNTMYHLLDSGRLQGVRIGRCWRVPGDALEKFLRNV
jgi:excisionase family DNA binding protein